MSYVLALISREGSGTTLRVRSVYLVVPRGVDARDTQSRDMRSRVVLESASSVQNAIPPVLVLQEDTSVCQDLEFSVGTTVRPLGEGDKVIVHAKATTTLDPAQPVQLGNGTCSRLPGT